MKHSKLRKRMSNKELGVNLQWILLRPAHFARTFKVKCLKPTEKYTATIFARPAADHLRRRAHGCCVNAKILIFAQMEH